MSAWVLCMSWCANLEFRAAQLQVNHISRRAVLAESAAGLSGRQQRETFDGTELTDDALEGMGGLFDDDDEWVGLLLQASCFTAIPNACWRPTMVLPVASLHLAILSQHSTALLSALLSALPLSTPF